MNRAVACAKLDYRLIMPYFKSVLLLLLLGNVMAVAFRSISMLHTYLMVSLTLVMIYPFTIGEKNGLDILYGTLSVSRANIVAGRYLFVVSLGMIFSCAVFGCGMLLTGVAGMATDPLVRLATLCVLYGVCLVIAAFQYPVYFKVGYAKGKTLALMPMLLLFLVIMALAGLAQRGGGQEQLLRNLARLMERPVLVCTVPPLTGAAALAISCCVSCRIYRNRDL